MANIANFEVDGVSYTYDTESRSPLALKNIKKAFDGNLVYGKDASSMTAPDEVDSTVEAEEGAEPVVDKVESPAEKAKKSKKPAAEETPVEDPVTE